MFGFIIVRFDSIFCYSWLFCLNWHIKISRRELDLFNTYLLSLTFVVSVGEDLSSPSTMWCSSGLPVGTYFVFNLYVTSWIHNPETSHTFSLLCRWFTLYLSLIQWSEKLKCPPSMLSRYKKKLRWLVIFCNSILIKLK